MKNFFFLLASLTLASCSKDEITTEVPQNKMTTTVDFTANGVAASYKEFTIQALNFPFSAFIVPTSSPVLRIETVGLQELDSIHTASQNVRFRYFSGSNTYVADQTAGDGYIVCVRNRNSETNVNVRDGSGNIKPAVKREEDLDLKFSFRARNQAAPFDTVRVTNGKLIRAGYYYLY
jgi:hypothetical protein